MNHQLKKFLVYGVIFLQYLIQKISISSYVLAYKNNNKFDFYNNNEAVEIKSTTNNIRKHHFSQSQLNTKEEIFVISLLLQDDIMDIQLMI